MRKKELRQEALWKWKGKFGFIENVEVLLSLSMANIAGKVCHLLKGTVMQLYTSLSRQEEKCCCDQRFVVMNEQLIRNVWRCS